MISISKTQAGEDRVCTTAPKLKGVSPVSQPVSGDIARLTKVALPLPVQDLTRSHYHSQCKTYYGRTTTPSARLTKVALPLPVQDLTRSHYHSQCKT